MHLGEFSGPAGRVLQRTETTPAQRAILQALAIKEPRLILDAMPARTSRRPSARTA